MVPPVQDSVSMTTGCSEEPCDYRPPGRPSSRWERTSAAPTPCGTKRPRPQPRDAVRTSEMIHMAELQEKGHRAWGTPRLGGGMPSRCRVLAMAFLQIFVFAENWALAKNINFYSVKPPLDPSSASPATEPRITTTATAGLRISGVRRECRSCCEGMICNIEVPTNHTNAVLVVLPALRASSGAARTPGLSMLALGLAARWL
ncbi:ly6/PLAUR domain-containing protein 6B isoform X3 [Ornithorhynchus anatinus]|uniref:ly6/PLAUR domain-containing protein 6B isoform X3 n=1 Tax=Ornithorhynchus anatinus TaxID=9258 RepID=UPI0010A805F4|nr:ly6/PLAUR domain-containing protein 6B isoform X3 [Ornithorhynchus anatinus]